MKIKVVLITLILIVCIVFDSVASVFWAQIKSSEKKNELNEEMKTLQNYSLPFAVFTFNKKETMYYRLRVGPFSDSTSAYKVSKFIGFSNPWIIGETTISDTQEIIRIINCDTLNALPKTPQYYVSKGKMFFALYIFNFGFEGAVMPSKMVVYADATSEKVDIDTLTGFYDTDSSILYGKPILLAKENTGDFNKTLSTNKLYKQYEKEFSNTSSLLTYYNDSSEVRINLLTEYLFGTKLMELYRNKPGIDYCDSSGNCNRWEGRMEGTVIGNARLQSFIGNKINLIKTEHHNIYCKVDDNKGKLYLLRVLIAE